MNQPVENETQAPLDLARTSLSSASSTIEGLLTWTDCPEAARSKAGVARLIEGGPDDLAAASQRLHAAMGAFDRQDDIL